MKVVAPIGSDAGEVELRGGFVGFGNTAPHGQLLVHGRRERLGPPATFNPNTGAGYVSPKEGDYARAEALGVRVVLMLVETHPYVGDLTLGDFTSDQVVRTVLPAPRASV